MFAEEEARLLVETAGGPAELAAMVEQRVGGLPLEHVLGWAEFHGRRWAVTPGVFVPRRRTEFLVEQAVARSRPGAVVLDLCCGTGAIGGAVAAALDDWVAVPGPVRRGAQSKGRATTCVYAVDVDPAAVACARRNLPGGHVLLGDLYAPLPAGLRGQVGVIVVVAPYVPSDAIRFMPPEARTYEPRMALDGGGDGLDVVRRVIAGAPAWLAPGGSLLLETGEDQASAAADACRRAGLRAQVVGAGEGEATVVVGTATARVHGRSAAAGGR